VYDGEPATVRKPSGGVSGPQDWPCTGAHQQGMTLVQCESKKIPPLQFSGIFSQTDGNFLINFYTPIIRSFLH